jgi:cholesterol oxidase
LPVHAGWFNLFVPGDAPDHRLMRYRLHLVDTDGEPLTLLGEKDVADDPAISQTREIWADTSTLAVRIHRGHLPDDGDPPPSGSVVGSGVLRIKKRDFIRQLTTFRVSGPESGAMRVAFGRFFAGQLWDVYGIR